MISVLHLGTLDYSTGLRLQQRLVELRKNGRIGDVLLLLEHTPVITLGRNAKAANVIASLELLSKRSVEVFECDRGGDVTFHGPGQVVGYPIFDLRCFPSDDGRRRTLGVVEYVRRLEEVLIRTCADFGIPAKPIAGLTGVWTDPQLTWGRPPSAVQVERSSTEQREAKIAAISVDRVGTDALVRPVEHSSTEQREAKIAPIGVDRVGADALVRPVERSSTEQQEAKIAAIGIHISRGVTSHGFALNVNTDLTFFDLIVPCGITAKPVTSMQKELLTAVSLQDVAHSISRNFGVVFQSQMLWLESLNALLGETLGVPMRPPAELRQLLNEDDSTWA